MIGLKLNESEPGTSTLEVRGDVAGRDSERLAEMLEEFVKQKIKSFVLDLRRVDFMDSAGLGTVTFHHMYLKKRKKKLTIILNKESFLSGVFEKTHLDKAITVDRRTVVKPRTRRVSK